ncbi:hypothetical protein [Streptomyces subrutilus]
MAPASRAGALPAREAHRAPSVGNDDSYAYEDESEESIDHG